jgi:hypothetical protein
MESWQGMNVISWASIKLLVNEIEVILVPKSHNKPTGQPPVIQVLMLRMLEAGGLGNMAENIREGRHWIHWMKKLQQFYLKKQLTHCTIDTT